MATQVQLRRGTTVQHSTFTGAVGEVTFDTDKNTLIVHDGSTAGGHELAKTGVAGSFTTGAFSSDVTITGNLTVNGTTTTVNSNTLEIGDNQIVLNSDETGTPSQNGGIEIERGTSTNVVLRWNETTDTWQATEDGTNYYNILLSDDIGVSVQGYDANNVVSDASSTFSADQNFADGVKATFGNASDLMIYHDGQRSIIQDQGTGNLRIQAANLELNSWDNAENYIFCQDNGAVTLYYDNAPKLATTSTGVDITGTLTSDGLNVGGDFLVFDNNGASATYDFKADHYCQISLTSDVDSSGGGPYTQQVVGNGNNGDFELRTGNVTRQSISQNGDISFYDTSGNAKFFWDAAAERLGLGTSSPSRPLHLVSSGTTTPMRIDSGTSAASLIDFKDTATTADFKVRVGSAGDDFVAYSGGSESVRVDDNGNVRINNNAGANFSVADDDSKSLTLAAGSGADAMFIAHSSGKGLGFFGYDGGGDRLIIACDNGGGANKIDFSINAGTSSNTNNISGISTAMRLDASGNFHVGKTGTGLSDDGTSLHANGTVEIRRNIGTANTGSTMYVSRGSTNGSIVAFYANSTYAGSIQVNSERLNIGKNDVGLRFDDLNNAVLPWNIGTNSGQSGSINIGLPTNYLFNDGHFAGTLYAARGVGATWTGSLSSSALLNYSVYTNWVITMTGNLTLTNPTTEIVGQSGFIIFKQDSTGGRTVSLGSEYLTAGGAGLTLSSAANAIDMVPYVVIASGQILLGTPQLAFA